ncbi:MAG: PKD domain-containing protein [Thermoplasmata archaeon]
MMLRESVAMLVLLASVCAPFPPRSGGGDARTPATELRREEGCVSRLLEIRARAVVDEAGHALSVSAVVSIQALQNTSRVFLKLNPAMNVTEAHEPSLGNLSVERSFDPFIAVSLGREVGAGTLLNITLNYSGEVAYSEDGGESYWDYIGPEGSWVRSYGWYFPGDERMERARATLSLTLPEGKMAIGPGELVGEVHETPNATVTYIWESRIPLIGLSFTVGRYVFTEHQTSDHIYRLYFRPEHAPAAPSYASEMARIVEFYTSLFGPPGFRDLTVVEVPGRFAAWGQSLPSMLWLSSRNFDGPLPYRLLSHELGHQWWGVDIEADGAGESWLREGFAGYSEAMYEMEVYGSRGYLEFCRQRYIELFVAPGGPEPLLIGTNYDLAGYKGPWVLHMLRYLIGSAEFNRSLSSFHQKFSGKVVNFYDFMEHIQSSTGRDLSVFFFFWMFSQERLDCAIACATVFQGEEGKQMVEVVVESRAAEPLLPIDLSVMNEGETIAFFPRASLRKDRVTVLRFEIDREADTVKLDPDGWLLDIATSNNEAPTAQASLDFSLSGFELQGEPIEGGAIVARIGLSSESSMDAELLGVMLLADGAPVWSDAVALPSHGRVSLSAPFSLSVGEHELVAWVDPDDRFYERNESNNILSTMLRILPPQPLLPNLRVMPRSLSVPAGATGGETTSLSAVVENTGRANAGPFEVEFWLEDTVPSLLGRAGCSGLFPGGNAEISIRLIASPGRHFVTVVVDPAGEVVESDEGDNSLSSDVYLNARPEPVLHATPATVAVWEWLEFSGERSVDDGRITHYFFDFGDGEESGWVAEPVTHHRYSQKGSYRARLRVLDDSGAESGWSPDVVVRVLNAPPVAEAVAKRRNGDVRTEFKFNSISFDPDGAVVEHLWDFGDGRRASGATVAHTFTKKGNFTVTLSVRDDEGALSSTSLNVTVRNLPPTASISAGKLVGLVGEEFKFSASGTTDPDDPPENLEFLWDIEGRQVNGPEAVYVFTGPGQHRVVLKTSDGYDFSEASVMVEVRSPPPSNLQGVVGWHSWALLGLLLGLMAFLVIYLTVPFRKRKAEEEE